MSTNTPELKNQEPDKIDRFLPFIDDSCNDGFLHQAAEQVLKSDLIQFFDETTDLQTSEKIHEMTKVVQKFFEEHTIDEVSRNFLIQHLTSILNGTKNIRVDDILEAEEQAMKIQKFVNILITGKDMTFEDQLNRIRTVSAYATPKTSQGRFDQHDAKYLSDLSKKFINATIDSLYGIDK